MKIYLFNPAVVARLADLLHQGLIMNRKFQPYEAHLGYILQFMADFNLYGCDYLRATKFMFRSPVPDYRSGLDSERTWHSRSIDPTMITDNSALPRASYCAIEVDICVQDIANRRDIEERRIHHDFIERLHPLASDTKLVPSLASLWKDEAKRRKMRMGNAIPGSSPFPPDALLPMSSTTRATQTPTWIQEEMYRSKLQRQIDAEGQICGDTLSFRNFVTAHPLGSKVRTVLRSVEDLFPDTLARDMALGHDSSEYDPRFHSTKIEVDEKGIFTFTQKHYIQNDTEAIFNEAEIVNTPWKQGFIGDEIKASQEGKHHSSRKFGPDSKSLQGITHSCLVTARPPSVPIFKSLLNFVEQYNWLEVQAPRDSIRQGYKKRKRVTSVTVDTKRICRERAESPKANYRFVKLPKESTKAPSSQLRKSHVVRRSSQGNIKMSFPIVRDPNDHVNKQRLSLKANSQQSEDEITSGYNKMKTPSRIISCLNIQNTANETQKNQVSCSIGLNVEKPALHFSSLSATPNLTSSIPVCTAITEALEIQKVVRAVSQSTYGANIFIVQSLPPTLDEVVSTISVHGLPDVVYKSPYYSESKDAPVRSVEFTGKEYCLLDNSVSCLPEFNPCGHIASIHDVSESNGHDTRYTKKMQLLDTDCSISYWEFSMLPPSYEQVQRWAQAVTEENRRKNTSTCTKNDYPCLKFFQHTKHHLSQIEAKSPKNKHDFKLSQKNKSTSIQHEEQYMSILSVEIHVSTRPGFVPNPEHDEVKAVFWAAKQNGNSSRSSDTTSSPKNKLIERGIIVVSEDGRLAHCMRKQSPGIDVLDEPSELDMLSRLISLVREIDPDILTGYEVHGSSWGYLIDRAKAKYEFDLRDELSRIKLQSHSRTGRDNDSWGFKKTSSITITGRHVINIWRSMRSELNLLQYTMENVVWHLCHKRLPKYSWDTLTSWYVSSHPRDLGRVLRYYLNRTTLDLDILDLNELIPRTSEQARLLGVDFFSVFARGSQFKVESIMFRIAKPENFVLVSPNRKQVGGQNALECLPLVMEPQSQFYNSPLVVLDFQSLYPSVIIAYNYCYSTFLGRVSEWRGTNKMGFATYDRPQGLLKLLQDEINISPNGMLFVKPTIRKSLLARMLTEILETRVMVKSGMKQDKEDRALQQLLNNRQLALKLLANVTYGYTSASFSGRMPCAEIADAIVQTGRETLERAIAFIHATEKWGAEVVYGDTDSLFVYLPGRSRAQAFEIGNEMAKAITRQNPQPIKLKFEKLYHPCVLLAKKRYVGYKYECPDQELPEFDAKGIETVRRDGTPAEQKIEEKSLRLLFETQDLSRVKKYFQAQCRKIMTGDVGIQDFCFAKEVKLGTYSERGLPPPGALVATKKMARDERMEPQYGERVPYVVIAGAPESRLADRCVSPEVLVMDASKALDAEYYINKNLIPPLDRIFSLVGANVRSWWEEMPKVQRIRRVGPQYVEGKNGVSGGMRTLESYMRSGNCMLCGVKIKRPLSFILLNSRETNWEKEACLEKDVASRRRKIHDVEPSGNVDEDSPDNLEFENSGSSLSSYDKYSAGSATKVEPGDGGKNTNTTMGEEPICKRCAQNTGETVAKLHQQLADEQKKMVDLVKVCQTCEGAMPLEDTRCESLDCPVWYNRMRQAARLRTEESAVRNVLNMLDTTVEW